MLISFKEAVREKIAVVFKQLITKNARERVLMRTNT